MTELEKIIQQESQIKLTSVEKNQVRKVLFSYMTDHPLPPRPNFWFRWLTQVSRPAVAFAVMTAVITTGTGVSYAAENALPGDWLYPVKVRVKEEFAVNLAPNQTERANLMNRRIEQRLQEMMILADQGRLNPTAAAMIQKNFERHNLAINRQIAELEKRNNFAAATEIISSLEASLSAHRKIMAQMARMRQEVKSDTELIIIELENRSNKLKQNRLNNEEKMRRGQDNRPKINPQINKIKRQLKELQRQRPDADRKIFDQKIKLINIQIEQAQATSNQSPEQAFILTQEADRELKESKVFLDLQKHLKTTLPTEIIFENPQPTMEPEEIIRNKPGRDRDDVFKVTPVPELDSKLRTTKPDFNKPTPKPGLNF